MHHLFRIYFKFCPNNNTLTLEKKEKILNLCQEILREDVVTIRFLLTLLGNLVAAFPAATLGPFHYRALEMNKAKALQQSNGNFDAAVRLSNGNFDAAVRLSNEVKK